MKGQDIVKHIENNLGRYTTIFNSQIQINSLTSSSGMATAVTSAPHSLVTGDTCIISGAMQYISLSSITREGNLVTVKTAQNNLLPLIEKDPYSTFEPVYVTIQGATPSEYNGTWRVYTSLDEFTFTFKITGTPTTPASVNGIMLVKDFQNYNGRKTVTVVDSTTFTYEVREDSLQTTGSIFMNLTNVTNVATAERINRIYDKNASRSAENWLYVLIGDATLYKKDGIPVSDVEGIKYSSENYNYELVQNFSIIGVFPEKEDITAGSISDIARSDVRIALLKTLGNIIVDTGLTQGKYETITYAGDETLDYEGTLPYYTHTYNFSTKVDVISADVSSFEDFVPLKETNVLFDEGLEVKIDY